MNKLSPVAKAWIGGISVFFGLQFAFAVLGVLILGYAPSYGSGVAFILAIAFGIFINFKEKNSKISQEQVKTFFIASASILAIIAAIYFVVLR